MSQYQTYDQLAIGRMSEDTIKKNLLKSETYIMNHINLKQNGITDKKISENFY